MQDHELSQFSNGHAEQDADHRGQFALSLVNIALEAGGPALEDVGVLVDIMGEV